MNRIVKPAKRQRRLFVIVKNTKPKYFTLKQVEEILRKRRKPYSSAYLSFLAREKKIRATKRKGKWVVEESQLNRFLEERNFRPKQKIRQRKKEKILNRKGGHFGWRMKGETAKRGFAVKKMKRKERGVVLPLYFGWGLKLALVRLQRKFFWPFRKHWQESLALIFLLVLFVSGLLLYHLQTTLGLTYTWTQEDWIGGATSTYPYHQNDNTGWTYFWSKSGSMDNTTAGQLQLYTYPQAPASGSSLPSPRSEATAIYDPNTEKIYIFGGFSLDPTTHNPTYLNEIVQYNPSNDSATTTNIGTLPVHLRGASAAYVNATSTYIIGGYYYESESDEGFNATIYRFNPSTPSVSATSTGYSLGQGVKDAAAVYASNTGKVYIFGGFYLDANKNPHYSSDVIEFNPDTGATSTVADFSTAVGQSGIRAAGAAYNPSDGKIYIFGGSDSNGNFNSNVYKFDPTTNTLSDTGDDLPSYPRSYMGVIYASAANVNKFFILGGFRLTPDADYLSDVVTYKPSTGEWDEKSAGLPVELKAPAVAYSANDDVIYIFGGYDGTNSQFSDSVYYYPFRGTLFSSPFNMTDPTATINEVEWTQTLATTTTVRIQLRSATNNDNGTPFDPSDDSPSVWSDWVGPDGTGDTYWYYLSSLDHTSGCTESSGTVTCGLDSIPTILRDGVDDHWIQYKMELVTESLNYTPVFSAISITYVINTAPTVGSVTASQDATGTISVSYDIADAESDTMTISLLYDAGLTVADNPLTIGSTTVNVTDPNGVMSMITATSTYTIQIESEQISCTGKTSSAFTGCTRGANNSDYYKKAHNQGEAIWIKAETVSGDVGSGIAVTSATSTKSISWTPKTDVDGLYLASSLSIKVNANDGNLARQITHSNSPVFEFDTKDPVVGTTDVGSTGVDINGNQLTIITSQDKAKDITVTLHLACSDDTAIQMQFSNDNVTYSDWQSYASSTSWDLSSYCPSEEYGCTRTVYVKFKDAKGNLIGPYSDTVTLDNNPPAVPANMYIQDVSNASSSGYRLFVAWAKNTESDWVRYEVFRSTDGTNFSQLATITLEQDDNAKDYNYYMDTGLTEGQTYYYKVRSVDDIINNSDYSNTVSMAAGGNPTDTSPPNISSIATSTPTINSVTITWTTDELSTSQVIYSTATSVPDGSPTQGVSGYVTSHSVTLTGLDSATTYYFKVQSADASSNTAESSIYSFTTATPDSTGPFIYTPITVSNISENSALVSWDTDESSDSFVEYSTTTGFSSGIFHGNFDFTTSHSVALSGLEANTTYYYKVHSTDSSGNESVSSEYNFTTSASSADVTPPVISNVATSGIAYNTATVTWTTDENSSSFVEFGLSTSYGRIYGQDDSVTSHSVSLPQDLSASTTYHFRVRSVDGAGNEAMSGDYIFTTSASPNDTTAPTISNVQAGQPQTTSITITWTTDEVSDSYIGYSASSTTYSSEQGSPTMVTSHSVTLVGLTPNTTYYFQVKSKDPSGNQATDNNSGQGYQFTTLSSSSNPPVISNVQIVNVSHNGATINWTTDQSSNSFIEYGLDTSYGSSQGQFDSVASHSVSLSGLLSEATYHFRARSTNSDGVEGVSQDYTFTTESAPDITPPVISNVQATSTTLTGATITWATDENADNIVSYGTSTSALNYAAGNNTDSTTSHSVSLIGLSPGTTYYYQVQSRDTSGNVTIDDNSGSYYSFTTVEDTTPPVISSVSSPVVDRNSATITWNTDEDATSQVEYSLNSDLSSASSTTETTDLMKEHSVIISNLTSATTYYYRVKSKDSSNNLATSSISSFTTAAASEDNTAPTISDVATSSVSMTGATITWTTDENSNSIVDYGTSVSLGSLAGQLDDSLTSHSVTLTGLSASTTYYFQVRSQDSAGNTGTDDNSGNYYTFITAGDTTAPTISDVQVAVVGETSASIVWQTDEDATSQVFYGTTNSYGSQTTLDSTLTKSHSVTISGLTKKTTYYYKVVSADNAGNSATDDNSGSGYTFTTTDTPGIVEYVGGGGVMYVETSGKEDTEAPVISDLTEENIEKTSVVISWKTNEKASGLVEYGENEEYGKIAGRYQVDETTHEVKLDDLFSGTTYYYRVISSDEWGNQAVSDGRSFTTQGAYEETEEVSPEEKGLVDQAISILRQFQSPNSFASVAESLQEAAQRMVSAPLIAGDYPSVSAESTEAEIVWLTDKKANSLVAYVPDEDYDPSKENPYPLTIGNTEEMVTKHTVSISGLSPNTIYHYQVISKPKVGPEARSEDKTFRTKSINPEIINLQLVELKEDSARFSWDTNVLTKSNLEYTDTKTGKTLIQGEAAFSKRHDFTLKNLNPGSSYSLVIKVIDEYGNEASSPKIKFSTGVDKEPPKIFQVNTDSTLYPGKAVRIQTIISWKTNEPSTGQVFWQEGIAQGAKVYSLAKEESFTVNHIEVITRFKPATVYKFWVESEDSAGNLARSKNFTILTPEKTETVFEMIVKNLQETFGWTKVFNK